MCLKHTRVKTFHANLFVEEVCSQRKWWLEWGNHFWRYLVTSGIPCKWRGKVKGSTQMTVELAPSFFLKYTQLFFKYTFCFALNRFIDIQQIAPRSEMRTKFFEVFYSFHQFIVSVCDEYSQDWPTVREFYPYTIDWITIAMLFLYFIIFYLNIILLFLEWKNKEMMWNKENKPDSFDHRE